MKRLLIGSFTVICLSGSAFGSTNYKVKITNGAPQPVSPPIVYVVQGLAQGSQVGQPASAGFTDLCRAGQTSGRLVELGQNPKVKNEKVLGAGPILPGETREIIVNVDNPNQQQIAFEAMYGMTKDACAVGHINSHSLYALKSHVTALITGTDVAVQTGAFTNPVMASYSDCGDIDKPVECLRSLSKAEIPAKPVRALQPYLPQIWNHLADRYGADQIQALNLPTTGSVHFQVELVH